MRRFFGTQNKNKAPPVSLDQTQRMLDGRIESLEAKIRKLDQDIMKHKEQMNRMRPGGAKNACKQRALRCLKQKKMYEQQLMQMQNQSFNMEQTVFATETMKDTISQVEAIKQANKTLGAQLKVMDVDAVADMQDDMQDLLEETNEIQELMSRSYEMPYDVDDEALEDGMLTFSPTKKNNCFTVCVFSLYLS